LDPRGGVVGLNGVPWLLFVTTALSYSMYCVYI